MPNRRFNRVIRSLGLKRDARAASSEPALVRTIYGTVRSPNLRAPFRKQCSWYLLFGCLCQLCLTSPILAQTSPSALPTDNAAALLTVIEQATVSAIERAERSVVAIARIRHQQAAGQRLPIDPLSIRRPLSFENPASDPSFVPSLFGSGVVISSDGFIVTCAHVLDDPRQHDYLVWLDKRSYPATVVGRPAQAYAADPFSDLAVLKIDAEDLTPITYGEPAELKKGKFVIALGNPDAIARDGQASASWGIVSNLSRVAPTEVDDTTIVNKETVHQYGTLIQTDAKLNLGTSGGALIDLQGRMIGLTTSLAAQQGYEQSAGFAIAADELFQRVVHSLRQGKLPEYGFLGIQPESVRRADALRGVYGARVALVIPGLPGDEAGLHNEDVIIEVGGHPIHNRNDLFRELSLVAAGQEVELVVQRPTGRSRTPQIVRLPARLSKKYVATNRPAFAIHMPENWRGLTVEYATALPSDQARAGMLSHRRSSPKVAVLSVEPGTAAWQAGLRPGYGVRSLNGVEVSSPEDFYRVVGGLSGDVKLMAVRSGGRAETIVVVDEPDEK